jgi:hypothetical protein
MVSGSGDGLRQQRTWPEAKREPVISTIPHFGNRDDVEQF